MLYRYQKRPNRKVHIVDDYTSLTFCKAENGADLEISNSFVPQNRDVCQTCSMLKHKRIHKRNRRKAANNIKSKSNGVNFYKSDAWVKLRYEILKDADQCLCCGASKTAARLTVDHVKPMWKYPELKLNKSNMQVLCMLCNKGKGGLDETDFRVTEVTPLTELLFTELQDDTRNGTKIN